MSPRYVACLVAAVSMLPAALPAAVYTVGPGGTHGTIQSAADTARLTFVSDEIRIAQGTWNERVSFGDTSTARLDISGGWNASFDVQTIDPALTVIDGGGSGATFSMSKFDGIATLRNLTFAGGRSPREGANLAVSTNTFARVEISDCIVRSGEALADGTDYGNGFASGIFINASFQSRVLLERCEVRDNLLQTGSALRQAGAVFVRVAGDATVRLADLDVHDNSASGAQGVGGLSAHLEQQGRLEVVDSRFADNELMNADAVASVASGAFFRLNEADSPTLVFRRNRVLRNTVKLGQPTFQLKVSSGGTSSVVMGDSLIADSERDGGGVLIRAGAAAMSLVNLTLAGNAGIDLAAVAGVTISNTLADSVTGIDSATVVSSRFGEEPGYVDRATGDYHLLPGASAISAGMLSPAGGLGTQDVEGNARVRGPRVDQGAYEADDPTLFVDGFENPQ